MPALVRSSADSNPGYPRLERAIRRCPEGRFATQRSLLQHRGSPSNEELMDNAKQFAYYPMAVLRSVPSFSRPDAQREVQDHRRRFGSLLGHPLQRAAERRLAGHTWMARRSSRGSTARRRSITCRAARRRPGEARRIRTCSRRIILCCGRRSPARWGSGRRRTARVTSRISWWLRGDHCGITAESDAFSFCTVMVI